MIFSRSTLQLAVTAILRNPMAVRVRKADVKESDIESAVVTWARKQGIIVAPKYLLPAERGWPDRTFYYEGRTAFIEFKLPGEKPFVAQVNQIKRLRLAGFKVLVCEQAETGIRFLEDILVYAQNPQLERIHGRNT